MKLEDLLSSRNCNNELYDCDIERWLGMKLDAQKRKEIKSKLETLVDKNN